MTRKVIHPAYSDIQTTYYDHPENGNAVVKFSIQHPNDTYDLTVTSHSKTDSFGRKVFDELQHGLGVTSRHFSYYKGEVTEEHAEAEKYKSVPTTQLIKEIVISSSNRWENDRILSYEYDNEERITKVTDSLDGVTEYTYDVLGQLLTETVIKNVDGIETRTVVNTMTYDNYGNILTKNGKVYAYDSTWKDKLISYDGQSITYDAQGNPTSYLGHELTWEKGRQLKSYDDITYTYNANGIRTSKTVDGIKHIFTLEGTKILREEWGTHTLIPLYDNEDNVCGIRYDQFTYFFVKNLQGDVIAITDATGMTRVRYTYDAWGKCDIVYDDTTEKIGNINPFRYRGYYYDNEIAHYYLQSRYYDPNTGRFINGDDLYTVLCTNIQSNSYIYCDNVPPITIDVTGFKTKYLTSMLKAPKYMNSQYDSCRVDINGTKMEMKDISYGLFGNIADNGCGVIAAYNVCLYYKGNITFYDMYTSFMLLGGPRMLSGKLGTAPVSMTEFLNERFHKVYKEYGTNTEKWQKHANNSACVVILYKTSGLGAHYISGIRKGAWESVRGKFYFYNCELVKSGKLYSVDDILKILSEKKGYLPLMFWGIFRKKGNW